MRTKLLVFLIYFLIQNNKLKAQNNISPDSVQVMQLAGLCKVWGALKYYHPQIQKGKMDWDSMLVFAIPKVKNAQNNLEYNSIIKDLIQQVKSVKQLKRPYQYLLKDTSVNNLDFKWLNNIALFTDENRQLLLSVIENYKPKENIYNKKEINAFDINRLDSQFYFKNDHYPDENNSLLALFRY